MEVILTKESKTLKQVVFKWTNNCSRYTYETFNVSKKTVDLIVLQNGHEGEFVNGWVTNFITE